MHDRWADLIDWEAAQGMLEIVGRAAGLPIQIRDAQGNVLATSFEPTFCQLIRGCRRGLEVCRRSAVAHCPTTAGKTVRYTAHCGILHLVAPIMVGEQRAGIIMVGALITSPCSPEALQRRAQFLNVSVSDVIEAAHSIPQANETQVEEAADLLASISLHLSRYAERRVDALRLQFEQQQSVEELAMLRRIVDIINSGLDVDRMLQLVAEFAVQMTRSDACAIRLREQNELICRATVGLRTDEAKRLRIAVGRGLTGRVALEAQAMLTVDVQCSAEALHCSKLLLKERLHGFLAVPIRVRGKVIGVLTVFKRKRYRYSEQDVKRLSLLADETAIALENALLYEEQVRARNRATLLAEVGKIFSSSLDIDELLQRITRKIGESLDAMCTITLLDEDSKQLVYKATFHRNPAKIDLLAKMLEESPPQIGIGLAGRVFQTGKAIFIDGNPDAFPDANRPYFREINLTSAIAVPMRARDRLLGVLTVGITDSDRRFSESEVALVHSLAERAAAALDNAGLYRRAEAERARLEAVISGMADGVVIFNKKGKVLAVNRAGSEIFGKHLGRESSGRLLVEKEGSQNGYPDPLREMPLGKVLADGSSVINAEMTLERPDGQLRVCQISAAPVRDPSGDITGAVGVFRDITPLKEAEKLKDELISVVSHEFRAPLTAILGYTQMLKRRFSRKRGADREIEDLDLIVAQAKRLASMVRDLLDISRIQSGEFTLSVREIILRDLIRTVAGQLQALSDRHTIIVRVSDRLPPVRADPQCLEQILSNLIGNAIKYSPGGGPVLVSARQKANDAVISVYDRGIGIEQQHLPRLFERFYRVDNQESREFEGVGLGLYITKLLVEAHKGRIWATSRKGRGSVFSFSLPLMGGGHEQSSRG